MTIEDYIGPALMDLRHAAGVSQSGLEIRTDLKRCYISRVENRLTIPTLVSIERIASGLNLQVSDVVLRAEQMMREEL